MVSAPDPRPTPTSCTTRDASPRKLTHARSTLTHAKQGKKKQFIDKNSDSTAHFHVVHRSQRDPRAADPDAPQRVLLPAETGQRKGASQAASQSTRAWLEEQDLGGFDAEIADPSMSASGADEFDDLRFGPGDDYDYAQHARFRRDLDA